MKTFTQARSILSVALLLGSAALAPAFAQHYLVVPGAAPYHESHMVWANGQAFWSGPSDYYGGGSYLWNGETKFDPHHYRSYNGTDPQNYSFVVFHPHPGPFECFWRKRVINSDFEYYNPYLLVCG